jgi:AraC-like DNA-binding protein
MSGSMTILEAGVRGGAIALLVLLAITACRDAWRLAAARYAFLFDLCAIAYLIESAPPLATVAPAWLVPIRLLSVLAPAVFQLWAAATFDDAFVPRWWRWPPAGGMAALGLWALLSDRAPAWQAVHVAAVLLVGAGIWQTLSGRGADLVEGRRLFRLVLAVGAGLCIIGLTLVAYLASQGIRTAGSTAAAGSVLVLALAAALMRLRVQTPDSATVPAAQNGRASAPSSTAIGSEERPLLDRLQRLMEHDRFYREEGLSIAMLAARLAIPEYRLRRLINQRLGYRNFTSFVNGYRLAESVAALADPAQAPVPVLTIALDAGFSSIGPFNRAFKARTGMTPTDFRRDRLERTEARAAE